MCACVIAPEMLWRFGEETGTYGVEVRGLSGYEVGEERREVGVMENVIVGEREEVDCRRRGAWMRGN